VADEALVEALMANYSRASERASAALALSRDRYTEATAALVLALSGETRRSQQLADELVQKSPKDTLVTRAYVPQIHGANEMIHGNPAKSAELLESARPFDLGGDYRTLLVRGNAYLRGHDGNSVVKEFRTILDHAGVNPVVPAHALARTRCRETLFRPAPHTRISSPSGKTPTPTSPS
jgi:hypothetical protein